MIEWAFGAMGTGIGLLLGTWLAIGKDMVAQRNKARESIWTEIQKRIMPHPQMLTSYQAVVSEREWARFNASAREISRIKGLEELGNYDPSTGSYPVLRELTDAELKAIDRHWERLSVITKPRWPIFSRSGF
ncbi:hypothetical protein [Vreelandella olivaria]|uniref:hypothetical protein n=1 Tax=Vreelandella olivaria TaxID=390919 RepID=UPI00201F1EA3|nr:hypothetical protein [Halomonas olivaria]